MSADSQQLASDTNQRGDGADAADNQDEEDQRGGSHKQQRNELRAELQSMRPVLARTQPSRRSCEVRLALADWLHRRVRRAGLAVEFHPFLYSTISLLHRYRMQVALLRSTLQRQLSEPATATVASSSLAVASPSHVSLSESS